MGSSPICDRGLLCCSKPGISVPKSDLFVPQISLKIKEDKIIKSKNEFKNTNEMLIAQKNEAKKMDYNRDVEYDNRINDKIKKQMDYMEEKDYRRKEEKKLRYKQALDKQMDQQRIRKKMEYDIENGNF